MYFLFFFMIRTTVSSRGAQSTMIVILRQRQYKICLAVYAALLIICTLKISEYNIKNTVYHKFITVSIKNENENERMKTKNPKSNPRHMETMLSKNTDEETTEVVSSTWLQHLCPIYKTTDASRKFLKLFWGTPSQDTIFFTQMSCKTSLTRREVRPNSR